VRSNEEIEMLQKRCANDNHGRAVVTVRFCSSCGTVVNANIRAGLCAPQLHATLRRAQHAYCSGCGEHLVRLR